MKVVGNAGMVDDKTKSVQPQMIVAKVDEEWLKKLQMSYVGFLLEEKDASKVSEGLILERYDWVKATYMGGNMMLLSSLFGTISEGSGASKSEVVGRMVQMHTRMESRHVF
jgi:hypothetical protein